MTLLIPTSLTSALAGLSDLRIGELGLVDLVIGLIVLGSVIGALKRRSGLLGALGSGLGAAVLCWLVVAGLVAWAPNPVHEVVAASAFAQHVPLPTHALHQAADWVGALVNGSAEPAAGRR